MKFIHLSDLHIGKNVNGYSMIDEQKQVFEQILGYIRAERPDAVIIAGDVYDRAVPRVDAVRLFDDFLTALAGEKVVLMLISGNHDSPERINFASRLLLDKRFYFYGAFDGTAHKVTLEDEYGEVDFWLLPFVKPASAQGMFAGMRIESCNEAVAAALKSSGVDYTRRSVIISHQFYTMSGITPERSESELDPIGGLDAVDASLIERFDYAALGHLHNEQRVGRTHIRYCGSPVKYSSSECKKSVTIAELRERGRLTVKTLPLIPVHDMREIKGELNKLVSGKISGLADREDYLHVILTDEDEIIDPVGKLRSVYPNIMSLSFENSRTSIDLTAPNTETIENLSPYELFSEFFLNTQGVSMNTEQAAIVCRLLETGDDE